MLDARADLASITGYPTERTYQELVLEERKEVRAYLGAVATRLRQQGAEVSIVTVEDRLPAEAIVHQARISGADFVVMTSHGRTGLRRLLLGSVAEAVVRQAPCPVLVIHPPSLSGTAEGQPVPGSSSAVSGPTLAL